jgi:hypothetical protein
MTDFGTFDGLTQRLDDAMAVSLMYSGLAFRQIDSSCMHKP